MLSQEKINILIELAKNGDETAKEEIFKNNIPLLKCIINRFRNKGVEYDDLYQIGSIGLIKAISNFDKNFGVKFSTYCVPMILGEIKRYIRDNGVIKVSRSIKILANKINRFIDDYQTKNNVLPSIEYLAKSFNITCDDVVIAMDSSKMPLSLYDKYEDDDEGLELIDKLKDDDQEEKILDKIQLKTAINQLDEREKKILILRYFRDKTQNEIAENIGVSQVQVSRLENKILDKIRLNF